MEFFLDQIQAFGIDKWSQELLFYCVIHTSPVEFKYQMTMHIQNSAICRLMVHAINFRSLKDILSIWSW